MNLIRLTGIHKVNLDKHGTETEPNQTKNSKKACPHTVTIVQLRREGGGGRAGTWGGQGQGEDESGRSQGGLRVIYFCLSNQISILFIYLFIFCLCRAAWHKHKHTSLDEIVTMVCIGKALTLHCIPANTCTKHSTCTSKSCIFLQISLLMCSCGILLSCVQHAR